MSIVNQKGGSTVEFAMLLPLLLLLVVAVSELGIRYYQLNTLTKSVQIAARYLSDVSSSATYANYTDNAKNLAVCGHIGACTSQEAVVPGLVAGDIIVPPVVAQHVQVDATYLSALPGLPSLNKMMGLAGSNYDIIKLQASSVMRFAQ